MHHYRLIDYPIYYQVPNSRTSLVGLRFSVPTLTPAFPLTQWMFHEYSPTIIVPKQKSQPIDNPVQTNVPCSTTETEVKPTPFTPQQEYFAISPTTYKLMNLKPKGSFRVLRRRGMRAYGVSELQLLRNCRCTVLLRKLVEKDGKFEVHPKENFEMKVKIKTPKAKRGRPFKKQIPETARKNCTATSHFAVLPQGTLPHLDLSKDSEFVMNEEDSVELPDEPIDPDFLEELENMFLKVTVPPDNCINLNEIPTEKDFNTEEEQKKSEIKDNQSHIHNFNRTGKPRKFLSFKNLTKKRKKCVKKLSRFGFSQNVQQRHDIGTNYTMISEDERHQQTPDLTPSQEKLNCSDDLDVLEITISPSDIIPLPDD